MHPPLPSDTTFQGHVGSKKLGGGPQEAELVSGKHKLDFPSSSAGKESACNAGDPDSIPGLGRSTREEIGYPLQYSWASLLAQMVKNLPATQETWVQSLSWEYPLEKGKAIHSRILAWRIPWTLQSMRSQRVGQD